MISCRAAMRSAKNQGKYYSPREREIGYGGCLVVLASGTSRKPPAPACLYSACLSLGPSLCEEEGKVAARGPEGA